MKGMYRARIYLIISLWCSAFHVCAREHQPAFSISLNGEWEMGYSRTYTSKTKVPGIVVDATKPGEEVLWYRKTVQLPKGDWQFATLELKGARFRPEVYVNGKSVSRQNGGMAPTFHSLRDPSVQPGNTVVIEIALQSLKDVPQTDASFIPPADQWRSNVSSGLWDDVVLHLHRNLRMEQIIPFVHYAENTISLHYHLLGINRSSISGSITTEIRDEKGKLLITKKQAITSASDSLQINYKNILKPWSPSNPVVYQLTCMVFDGEGKRSDVQTVSLGIKEFKVMGKQFYLNGNPCKLRGGTVVWHRWVRSEEGRALGYDTAWFKKNIIQRLKDHGANYLRFHLGKPPETFLDLCDRYGLVVQYEWSFFHGMPASKESLLEQYKNWLDIAVHHPAVSLLHPYNETEGDQLETVWDALDILLKNYPPLVLEERDVIHVHKYWWSLFENLGLYYDSAEQFPKAIMVDEFGGNYLDEKGELGGYKALKESYLRFLGRDHNANERLRFHAMTNSKVAEYWRRIGAAGFAPFCILGSWEDGNNWFLGSLKDGNPKPVWNELTAAFSPVAVSVDLWDRNFIPNQQVNVPVYYFNDTDKPYNVQARLSVHDTSYKVFLDTIVKVMLQPFADSVQHISLQLPAKKGNYTLSAEVLNKPAGIKYPVVSNWDIHIFQAQKPAALKNIAVAIPEGERELLDFFQHQHMETVSVNDPKASVIIASLPTWKKLAEGDSISKVFAQAIDRGIPVIQLDAGERYLGQGYPANSGDLGPLQGVARITDPKTTEYHLFKGISLRFTEAAEPESHLHADIHNNSLWKNIPEEYTWLWNGMRGGLIAPAADMEFHGLSPEAFLTQWRSRGADEKAIKSGSYYAYELQGFYEFSPKASDKEVEKKLKDKVIFLVQDAPALANSINPSTPVKITDLSADYRLSEKGEALSFVPLASCGKNLTRTPVASINFGERKGMLVVSQLLTAGRLSPNFNEKGFYGIRYDEVTAQMVLNMINLAVNK